jgi:flagellar basal body P-ring protein FlgI
VEKNEISKPFLLEASSFDTDDAEGILLDKRFADSHGLLPGGKITLTHGGVKVEVVNLPEVIQPRPFSLGRTEVVPNPSMVVEEKDAEMVVLDGNTTVSELAQALNSLGVTPRDVIAILQAIKEAGALHANLVLL